MGSASVALLQCSGNRRSHFVKTYKKAEGIPWNQGGVSTAVTRYLNPLPKPAAVTSVCGLQLLAIEALRYQFMRP